MASPRSYGRTTVPSARRGGGQSVVKILCSRGRQSASHTKWLNQPSDVFPPIRTKKLQTHPSSNRKGQKLIAKEDRNCTGKRETLIESTAPAPGLVTKNGRSWCLKAAILPTKITSMSLYVEALGQSRRRIEGGNCRHAMVKTGESRSNQARTYPRGLRKPNN